MVNWFQAKKKYIYIYGKLVLRLFNGLRNYVYILGLKYEPD